MDYFIDTNIAIAFTFFPDKFHNPSKDFIINTVEDIYWSNNVQLEYDKKYDAISNKIKTFLNEIVVDLEDFNGVFLNLNSFEDFVLKNTMYIDLDIVKKRKLILIFWEKIILGYFKENKEFYHLFQRYSTEVPKCFNDNHTFLRNSLILFDCGEENYKKYSTLQNYLKIIGVHKPDYKIILDAHDFAQDRLTVFVSADEKFLNKVKNLQDLNVDEYMLLKEDYKFLN